MCLCVCVLLGHNICIYYSPAARFSIRGRQTTDLYALVLLYMHGGFHPDFIMMGQSDRWDRLSWIHNLRLPLLSISLPSPCSQSQKLMHWLHLHKNNIILSNRRPTDASSRLDRFLTTIRSPRVIHSHPPTVYAMFSYACASVQPDGLRVPCNSRTVLGVTQRELWSRGRQHKQLIHHNQEWRALSV